MTTSSTEQPTTPTPMPESAPEVSGYRWVMLLLMCLVYGSFGLVSQSLAPLVPIILKDLDITRTTMGFILGSWQFVYLFVAIPAGAIIDKFGLRRAMLMGIGFVALSQMIRAGAVHPLILLAGVMVFGLGGPFISVGAPKLTSLWFPQKEIGLALGIYTISPSIGSMISTSTANSVVMPLTGFNWHLTLLCYAGIAVMAALAWLLFARDPDSGKSASAATTSMFSAFKMLLGFPVVRIVLVMATGTFLFNHSFNNWLNTILVSQGMTLTDAGFWAAFPTIIAIAAALFVPGRTTQQLLVPVQVVVFSLWAVSALLIAFTTGPLQIVGLVLLGLGRGASTPLLMLTLLRSPQVGPKLMGAAGGLFFTAGEVGGVLGPSMTGMLADMTGGSYTTGIIVLAVVSGLLAVLSFPLGAFSGAAVKKDEQEAKA